VLCGSLGCSLWLAAGTCAVVIAAQVADTTAPTVDEELKAMQGMWKVSSVEIGGKASDVKVIGMERFRIAGTKLSVLKAGKVLMSVEMMVDPAKDPKQMDWSDPKRGKYPLIYSLEGDTLQLCFPLTKTKLDAPLERPESFQNPDKPIVLLKAERQKGKE
jgi:uncharacterized protein (TIGR03067 family)